MISIICPSRGRPEKAKKLIKSAIEKSRNGVEIIFYLNNDDSLLKNYLVNDENFHIQWLDKKIVSYTIGPDQPTAKSWNELAKQAKGDIIIVCGDDVEFKTSGWDTKIKQAAAKYDDGYCIISCNDGRGGKDSHPHPIYTRKMYEALGYVMHPAFLHWGPDTFAAALAQSLGRHIWLEDVLLEHQKPSDHGVIDETHARIRKGWMHERDMYVKNHPAMQRVLDAEVNYIAGLINKEYQ